MSNQSIIKASVLGLACTVLAACGGGSSGTATDNTTVTPVVSAKAKVSVSVDTNTAVVGQVVNAKITMSNASTSAITGVGYNINFAQAGLTLSAVNFTTGCNAFGFQSSASSGITISATTVNASVSSCTLAVKLTYATTGTKAIAITGLTNAEVDATTALPVITVTAATP
jgi:hypothetical protein